MSAASLDPAGVAEIATSSLVAGASSNGDGAAARGQKRPRDSSATPAAPAAPRPRIEAVIFGGYEIQTSYAAPYPLEDLASGSGTGGSGAAGEKRPLVKENSGRFGARASGDDKTQKTAAATNSRRKSHLAASTTKSITPELAAPSPAAAGPSAHQQLSGKGVSTDGPMEVDPEIVEDSEAGSPAAPGRHDSSNSFATDTSEVAVASSLLSTRQMDPPPIPVSPSTLVPASVTSETSIAELPPVASSSVTGPHPPSNSTAAPSRNVAGPGLPMAPSSSAQTKLHLEAVGATEADLNPGPAAPAAEAPCPAKHLTVREQREIKKKARAEREREAAANGAGTDQVTTKRLFVCEGCFKYMLEPTALTKHQKECQYKRPPGKKVYQRGAHTIYEVDGAVEKLYCQNLCLFGKLFIEHKYMFFDLEGFIFYIITDATPSRDWPIAYFSKEKVSYDDYNLACIVTFPQYRQKGWATLLIEFSYEITRRTASTPGTPERPLSALGMRGYLAYWTGVLVRYFRAVFEHLGEPPHVDTPPPPALPASPDQKRKGRASKAGFDGELPGSGLTVSLKRDAGGQASAALVARSTSRRRFGGNEDDFTFPTSLTNIAEAINIRPDDAAFALVESGLAQWRRPTDEVDDEGGEKVLELVISRELVEQVAKEKGVKDTPMLDLKYVLL